MPVFGRRITSFKNKNIIREQNMNGENWRKDNFLISTDKDRLQFKRIHEFLSKEAYWSLEIPLDIVIKAAEGSWCFGLYDEAKVETPQIGYARIVSDYATFAWICDVFVFSTYRGEGLAQWLLQIIMNHKMLQGLRRICLTTKDAHRLYEKFGFKITEIPQSWMEIKDNDIYKKTKTLINDK